MGLMDALAAIANNATGAGKEQARQASEEDARNVDLIKAVMAEGALPTTGSHKWGDVNIPTFNGFPKTAWMGSNGPYLDPAQFQLNAGGGYYNYGPEEMMQDYLSPRLPVDNVFNPIMTPTEDYFAQLSMPEIAKETWPQVYQLEPRMDSLTPEILYPRGGGDKDNRLKENTPYTREQSRKKKEEK